MSEETQVDLINNLRSQLANVAQLRELAFDNSSYDAWRVETGRILAGVFKDLGSEKHPCVEAFLAYRIPHQFTPNRDQMQEFYVNILGYQASLLSTYIDDLQVAMSANKSDRTR